MKKSYFLILFLCFGIALQAQDAFKTSFDFNTWPGHWSSQSTAKDGGWQLFNMNTPTTTNAGFAAGGDWSYAYTSDVSCQCDKSEDLLIFPGVYSNETPWMIAFDYFMPGVQTNSTPSESLSLVYSVDKGITWAELETFTPTQNKDWQKAKVSLQKANAKHDIRLAIRYSDGGGQTNGAAIDNLVVTPFNANAIHVKSLMNGEITAWKGQPFPLELEITNLSDEPLTEFSSVIYSDGKATYSGDVVKINILPSETQVVTVPVLVNNEAVNLYQIGVQALPASGLKDKSKSFIARDELANDPQSFVHGFDVLDIEVLGLQVGSVSHNILAEEATGTWCGWCPRGAVIMDQLAEEFPDFIPVAVHNSDPMVDTEYNAWMAGSVDGYPSGHVQRRTTKVDPLGFEDAYNSAKAIAPSADLSMQFQFDEQTRILDVTLTAAYLVNAFGHRFNVILTEDNVTGVGSGWAQANYYAGGGQGVMGGYEALPNPVPASQMVYDHVARALLGTAGGLNGSIPFQAKKNESYTYTFNYTVPAGWNVSKMHVIGVLHNDGNKTINTAVSASLLSSSSEDLPTGLASLDIFPNPANGSTNLRLNLESPQMVRMQIVDILGRPVAVRDYGMQSGDQIYPIETATWASGIYHVVVYVGTSTVSRSLVVGER